MDIISFASMTSPLSAENLEEEERSRRALLSVDGDSSEWCLWSLDVRNLYGRPFEVIFDRNQEGEILYLLSLRHR